MVSLLRLKDKNRKVYYMNFEDIENNILVTVCRSDNNGFYLLISNFDKNNGIINYKQTRLKIDFETFTQAAEILVDLLNTKYKNKRCILDCTGLGEGLRDALSKRGYLLKYPIYTVL